ncbi:hypothetical protein F3Y22_tig00112285pilonHSYRG00151 [Hibiscus syriacus]|uniref:Uncharacterized protein n=1 Tax=Hibiscus syriacus TaxID=106335 RepID=A0A6A2Y0P9_HIBSY|nr:hypothetical protein F3Y22_tig00112285pilonHSYRG00151 [Hibiscus syriacus]
MEDQDEEEDVDLFHATGMICFRNGGRKMILLSETPLSQKFDLRSGYTQQSENLLRGSLGVGLLNISTKAEAKRHRLFAHRFLPMILLLSAASFIGSAFIVTDYKEDGVQLWILQYTRPKICETQCRAYGSEALPRGIVSETSDLEMLPLWGLQNKKKPKLSKNLLAIAVGTKQKANVNKMIKKFPESDFAVMLFHYDGIVDQWKNLEWNDHAIHVSAANQTKWWFAKRFLHPNIVSEYSYIFLWDEDLGVDHFDARRDSAWLEDSAAHQGLARSHFIYFPESDFAVMLFHYDGIVDQWKNLEWNDHAIHVSAANQTKWWFAKRFLHPNIVSEYSYIFLWDEDLGVDHFDARRYLSIVKKEGLDISQPALDPEKSELHHPITARDKNSTVHRRTYKVIGRTKCNKSSTGPPCTGFVEMMAPVFSRASWRCSWHMIQGDRTQKIGVVDSEYLVHDALPTLGGEANKGASPSNESGGRSEVKKQSFIELEIFKNRWKRAVKQDNCWSDPYDLL